jgi:hypothetical protein
VFQEEAVRKPAADSTYLSATGGCLRSRRFPIEIIRPDKYIKIKSKHFGYSEGCVYIARLSKKPPFWHFRFDSLLSILSLHIYFGDSKVRYLEKKRDMVEMLN